MVLSGITAILSFITFYKLVFRAKPDSFERLEINTIKMDKQILLKEKSRASFTPVMTARWQIKSSLRQLGK